MKIQNLIPAMTIVRVGIGLLTMLSAVSYLMFAPTWVLHISHEALAGYAFDETTLIHLIGAVSLVYGATLVLGLYTRMSALLVCITQCIVLVLDFHNFSLSNLALPLSALIVLITGADAMSIDAVYLEQPDVIQEKKQPFGSTYVASPSAPPQFSKTVNGFLFSVIGFLLLLIVGYATVFVRTTPALASIVAIVLEPHISSTQNVPVVTAPAAQPVVPTVPTVPKKPAVVAPKTPVKTGYTLAQVAQHSSAASCYSVVSGNVYDLTPWIAQHPGGSGFILGMCGIDATDAFTGKHGGQARPASELAGFKIGPLLK